MRPEDLQRTTDMNMFLSETSTADITFRQMPYIPPRATPPKASRPTMPPRRGNRKLKGYQKGKRK